ncbi:hypothetical protein P691DRAFT_730692 [Macrolepiota fuliginosa MF-IS2]|uniref:Uncharacterized protein n=1 Tax=Macrolepiota fuliginosa MF-IS2 TaxID=1400762 RepID=A0A9P5XAL0_9AGAR|nr:hypothetical protein P691DRAFT_730692 [Macrolepiota fuliginosa MF-IS2]
MRSLSPGLDKDQTLINQNDNDDNGWTDDEPMPDDDVYFHWETEETLFSDLLEEFTPEAGDAELAALAESLQKPFDEESRRLKKEIASVFVPLVNRIRRTYASIERTVDVSFGAGLLAFNGACKNIEKSTALNVESLQKAHAEHKTRVVDLLGNLEEEYARREQLWVNFQKAMDELVNPMLELLSEAPAKMERTIANIEKQSRALEKESASATANATALTLKDLLSKLG